MRIVLRVIGGMLRLVVRHLLVQGGAVAPAHDGMRFEGRGQCGRSPCTRAGTRGRRPDRLVAWQRQYWQTPVERPDPSHSERQVRDSMEIGGAGQEWHKYVFVVFYLCSKHKQQKVSWRGLRR